MRPTISIALALLFTGAAVLALLASRQGSRTTGLSVPPGFSVSVFAHGFSAPRFMALSANGDVFLSDMSAGSVLVLRDKGGVSAPAAVFASGLRNPHGLAFHRGFLYVATEDAVLRFAYADGDLKATSQPETLVDLPAGGHSTRSIAIGPDGRLYVSVGSTGNVDEESDARRAAVWVYGADGRNGRLYASGLRNAVGLDWIGDGLAATNNGVDHLGDHLPLDALFRLGDGSFYGWPYCYVAADGTQAYDTSFGKKTADICTTAIRPVAVFAAHSAPLGLAFYGHKEFPAEFRGKIFVALHGSWAASEKVGYKVVTVDPSSGAVSDFLTGFLNNGAVSGRPVDVLATQDGSLLVSDDFGGKVWRIAATH